jgi:hypothetical protein
MVTSTQIPQHGGGTSDPSTGGQSGQASALLACQPGGLVRKNIVDKEYCFFNCLYALTVATVVLIADLVEVVPLSLRTPLGWAAADGHSAAAAAGQPEAVGVARRDAAHLSQRPGEQRLLQLLVS